MKLTTILFDLDGTLLPMDQDRFIKGYLGQLVRTFAPLGYEPAKMQQALMEGIGAMISNDGSMSNENAFWQRFCAVFSEAALGDKPRFDAFYRNEFQQVRSYCGFDEKAGSLVRRLKERGYRVALATNPLFPAVATNSRIRWAGLEPEDFEWVTTYENSSFSKPNLLYYQQILTRLGVKPEECLMVGNDVGEDMIAEKLGMRVFLLTECLINRQERDIAQYPHGGFDELEAYIANYAEK